MKKIILIFVLTTIGGTFPSRAAFGRIAAEKELRIVAEKKLNQEQNTNTKLQAAASILCVGCIAMLVVGAAIGSKGRRRGPQE